MALTANARVCAVELSISDVAGQSNEKNKCLNFFGRKNRLEREERDRDRETEKVCGQSLQAVSSGRSLTTRAHSCVH